MGFGQKRKNTTTTTKQKAKSLPRPGIEHGTFPSVNHRDN